MSNKTAIKSQDLRKMAEMLVEYSDRYVKLAESMDAAGLETLDVTGLATFQDKVIGNLGRNTRRISTQLQTALDDRARGSTVASGEVVVREARKKARSKKKGEQ